MLKGSKKDILGKTPEALSPEKQPNGKYSKDYAVELIAEVIQKGHIEFEWVHLRKDGTEILIEIILSKIERDQEVTLFTTWRDVTEKRKTEHALIKSEQRLSQIAEHSNSVIWEVDQNGIYSYISPVSTRIFGYKPEELVGKKHIWDLFPDDYNKVGSEHQQTSQYPEKTPFNWENQILRKDGNVIWVSRFGSAIEDESGRIIGYRGVDNDITSRKLAEEELMKFRMISDKASYGTVITETKTSRITYCNQTFAKMHGYEVQELIGMEITKLHTPEQLKFYYESIYPDFIAKGEYTFKEFGRKRKDGSTFPGLVSAKQFLDKDGLPIFNASTVIDISKEKKISEQIQEQNLRLRSIIEAIPDILYIMDGEGNYLEYFSSSDANTIGDFSELVGKNLREVYDEEEARFHLGKIKKTLSNRKIETYEYSGMKGYQHRFFESRLVPMTENKVLRFVREITERKKSENEIKRLTLAIEQSPVAIVITDLRGNLEYFSPAFLQMTGYTYEELKGKPISIIKSGLTEKSVYQDLWKTISSGKSWSTEWRNKKKNGEIFWETVSITPILDEKKQIKNFLAVKQDNTEKKHYEQEILELNINLEKRINERTLELEKSNRQLEIARIEADSANQAKSEFLSRMSHELRTPMNSILGFAQLLELTELKESQRKSLEYILKSGNHLLQLINEVLEISRIESGNITISLKPVELIGMIEEVIGSVMPFAANQSIDISFSKDPWKNVFVLSDAQRLKQILINLLNNAIKYNKKEGKVKLFLTALPEEQEKKYIRINVEDTGIGISGEKIHKLFRPFERADQDHSAIEGTGLGLSVVEKLTKLMGGKVGVESQKGVGSKFWVELPITEENVMRVEESSQKEVPKISSYPLTGKLLLVEDNIPNIELIRELLASLMPEIQLLTTMYGLEALEIAKKSTPSLILLDLNLPDSNGAKILEILKRNEETREIPVIVVSADATTKHIEEILEMGADQYITKPINIGQMISIFHHYLKLSPND